MDMAFEIITGSAQPIYRQLVDQVKRRVLGGQLKAGDEVPSVRHLAQALSVNPMTVSKAYSMLEVQGVLERRRGLSMVVAAQHQEARPSGYRSELLRPTLEKAATEAEQLGLTAPPVLKLFKSILGERISRASPTSMLSR